MGARGGGGKERLLLAGWRGGEGQDGGAGGWPKYRGSGGVGKKGLTKTTRKRGVRLQRGRNSNVYRIALTLHPAVAVGRRKPSCSSTVLPK